MDEQDGEYRHAFLRRRWRQRVEGCRARRHRAGRFQRPLCRRHAPRAVRVHESVAQRRHRDPRRDVRDPERHVVGGDELPDGRRVVHVYRHAHASGSDGIGHGLLYLHRRRERDVRDVRDAGDPIGAQQPLHDAEPDVSRLSGPRAGWGARTSRTTERQSAGCRPAIAGVDAGPAGCSARRSAWCFNTMAATVAPTAAIAVASRASTASTCCSTCGLLCCT